MALITQGVQALKLTEVWKSFDGVDALKGVTFEAQAGEVHACSARTARASPRSWLSRPAHSPPTAARWS